MFRLAMERICRILRYLNKKNDFRFLILALLLYCKKRDFLFYLPRTDGSSSFIIGHLFLLLPKKGKKRKNLVLLNRTHCRWKKKLGSSALLEKVRPHLTQIRQKARNAFTSFYVHSCCIGLPTLYIPVTLDLSVAQLTTPFSGFAIDAIIQV